MKVYAVVRAVIEENDGGEHEIIKAFTKKEDAQRHYNEITERADKTDGYIYLIDEYEN